MDHTYVDAKKVKSLEDYAMSLVSGMLSLKTLQSFHIRAIEIGILTEDMACRANTIIWDISRDMRLYKDQLETVLELLPPTFNEENLIDNLKKIELTKARSMTRKPRVKK